MGQVYVSYVINIFLPWNSVRSFFPANSSKINWKSLNGSIIYWIPQFLFNEKNHTSKVNRRNWNYLHNYHLFFSLHFNFLSSIYSIKKTSFWKCPAISRKSKLYINSLLCFIWNMKKINFRKFLSFSGELFWGTRDFRRPVSILLRTLTSGIINEPVKKSISKWLNWKSIILAERIHLTS